jgi:hypothetical protein
VKREVIAAILSSLNDECGRLNELDCPELTEDDVRTILNAYDAVGKIRAEDVSMDRLDRINSHGGALSWCGHSFAEHPDRCKCQDNDPIPHRHYGHAPYACARCVECRGYDPVESK